MRNVDFSYIVSAFTLRQINDLEAAMLHALGYHVEVSLREYAKYYFMLRSMLLRYDLVKKGYSLVNLCTDAETFKLVSWPDDSFKSAAHRRIKSYGESKNLIPLMPT